MSEQLSEQAERNRYRQIVADPELTASEAALTIFKEYARERPEVVAYWAFGLGFLMGWKLKMW